MPHASIVLLRWQHRKQLSCPCWGTSLLSLVFRACIYGDQPSIETDLIPGWGEVGDEPESRWQVTGCGAAYHSIGLPFEKLVSRCSCWGENPGLVDEIMIGTETYVDFLVLNGITVNFSGSVFHFSCSTFRCRAERSTSHLTHLSCSKGY